MSKIFILGFNGQSPRGGMLDLLTTVGTTREIPFGDGTDMQAYALNATTLSGIVARFPTFEHYQVVHMGKYGSIQMVEHWVKARFLFIPSDAERASGAIFENKTGDYVRRIDIQTECDSSVAYVPRG
jgi:hypothetical protein